MRSCMLLSLMQPMPVYALRCLGQHSSRLDSFLYADCTPSREVLAPCSKGCRGGDEGHEVGRGKIADRSMLRRNGTPVPCVLVCLPISDQYFSNTSNRRTCNS